MRNPLTLIHGAQLGFSLYVLLATKFWSSLIISNQVVSDTSRVLGATSLKQASDRGDSVCVGDSLWETALRQRLVTPSVTSKWDRDRVSNPN
jgi:hypothetical protein